MPRGFPSGAPGRRPRYTAAQREAAERRIRPIITEWKLDMAEAAEAMKRAAMAMQELAVELELMLDDDPYSLIEAP